MSENPSTLYPFITNPKIRLIRFPDFFRVRGRGGKPFDFKNSFIFKYEKF